MKSDQRRPLKRCGEVRDVVAGDLDSVKVSAGRGCADDLVDMDMIFRHWKRSDCGDCECGKCELVMMDS